MHVKGKIKPLIKRIPKAGLTDYDNQSRRTIVLEDSVMGGKGLDTQPALKELTY